MHTVDYDKYKYGGVNITGLRMIDPAKRDTIEAINKWSNWEMNSGKVLNFTEKTLTVYLTRDL